MKSQNYWKWKLDIFNHNEENQFQLIQRSVYFPGPDECLILPNSLFQKCQDKDESDYYITDEYKIVYGNWNDDKEWRIIPKNGDEFKIKVVENSIGRVYVSKDKQSVFSTVNKNVAFYLIDLLFMSDLEFQEFRSNLNRSINQHH